MGLTGSDAAATSASQHRAMQEDLVRPMRLILSNLLDPAVAEFWDSEPNPGLNGGSVNMLAGSSLGGTSAINGAQFSIPEAKVPPPPFLACAFTDTYQLSGSLVFRGIKNLSLLLLVTLAVHIPLPEAASV